MREAIRKALDSVLPSSGLFICDNRLVPVACVQDSSSLVLQSG